MFSINSLILKFLIHDPLLAKAKIRIIREIRSEDNSLFCLFFCLFFCYSVFIQYLPGWGRGEALRNHPIDG